MGKQARVEQEQEQESGLLHIEAIELDSSVHLGVGRAWVALLPFLRSEHLMVVHVSGSCEMSKNQRLQCVDTREEGFLSEMPLPLACVKRGYLGWVWGQAWGLFISLWY